MMTESVAGEMIKPDEGDTVGVASIRVNVGLLDTLMTLAGELVLSRNQLLQGVSTANIRATELSSQRIDLITSELQDAIMRTRMQPMADVFSKFKRIVRDLSGKLGKSIDLDIQGHDVELDKTIQESIGEPLTRLVEHSVCYGIETPEQREQAGKTATGKLTVQAFHDAGQVNVLVSDDGRGLDEKIADDASRTAVMDSVVSTIERLGGMIDIKSTSGKGTDIHIKLPLTLAIIPSQITSVGAERYALPQVNLEELLRIPAGQIQEKIEKVGDAAVVRLRGELLPLLDLAQVLGIEKDYVDPETNQHLSDRRKNIADRRSKQHLTNDEGGVETAPEPSGSLPQRKRKDRRSTRGSAVNIAVVAAGPYKYGLMVDQLHDSEEIVVKPVGRHLKHCTAYAGATIMGDGKVALILDIANLAHLAGLSIVSDALQAVKISEGMRKTDSNREALLTFKQSEKDCFAVPLNLVERIERIKTSSIEQIGNRKVVQYRGGALPLHDLSQVMALNPLVEKENQEIIIFRIKGKELGLMVSPPVDSVEAILDIDESTLSQPGIKGSIIINGHTTLLVNMFDMARIVKPEWFAD
ncbi:MAG: chemotaxis protein CheW [Pseudomonadota bacterium]